MKRNIEISRKKKGVFEGVLEYFTKTLTDGKLKPGDRLLSERDLAIQFKVSRATIREVMRALEMLGILSIIHGRGTFILPSNPYSLARFLNIAFSMRRAIYESISEVRMLLECGATRLACKRATPEDLSYIKRSVSKMHNIQTGKDLGLKASQADFEFHKGIIRGTHNDFLIFLYEVLELLIKRNHAERWAALLKLRGQPKAVELAEKSHKGIYEGIAEGDEVKAEDLMRAHFKALDSYKIKL